MNASTMNANTNAALERLTAEQGYCRLYYFRALIKSMPGFRNLEIYARSPAYARRMAEAQVGPGDEIVSIRAYY